MKVKRIIIGLAVGFGAIAAAGQEIESVASALERMNPYASTVSYSITLPQAEDDIVYTVDLQALKPGQWLIDWSVDKAAQKGWAARFGGNFYNYRNRRLQEIHQGWDKQEPPRVQFTELLPENIASQLRTFGADTEKYHTEVTSNADELTVRTERLTGGEVDAEFKWTFDSSTGRPLRYAADFNPGTITAQQISATFAPAEPTLTSLSEELLRERYGDAFANHRQSNFAIEQMRGEPLPGFSIQLADGQGRMTRQEGEEFLTPVLVVMLESRSTLAPELVEAVRRAVDRSPVETSVIWACMERNPESATDLLGQLRPGETALIGAKKLATECGAADLPVILVCDRSATVRNLVIGLNKETETDVIQMITQL